MTRLRRAVHFVPGGNERMLAKALTLEADTLVLDLEDAVTPERKDAVRAEMLRWLQDVDFGHQEKMVRMNPLESPWGLADLELTMRSPPDCYMVPKVASLADVQAVDEALTGLERRYGHAEGGVKLLLVATEVPDAVLNIRELPRCDRVDAITWGAEDLSAALGARRNREPDGTYLEVFRYCRSVTLISAVAAGVQPVDGVYVDFRDERAFRRDCEIGAAMGYTGKVTIHPSQIPIVNEYFTPSPDEIAEAQELLDAFEDNRKRGRMAFSFKGEMVDVPHLERARTIVERARQAGVIE
jgi:citrate lyase subunit beta/citryl-CoA lyase